jgi:hypothetical protein
MGYEKLIELLEEGEHGNPVDMAGALRFLLGKVEELESANELKIWGEGKPDVGRRFAGYERCSHYPSFFDMEVGGARRVTYGPGGPAGAIVSFIVIPDEARWCYVPEPPDWDAIVREG